MKKWNRILGILLLTVLVCGCGAKNAATEAAYDMAAPAEAPMAMGEVVEEAVEEEAGVTSTDGMDSVVSTTQKLIKTVNMGLETKEFDGLLDHIKNQVEEMGGYIENSEISGNSYYNQNGNRYAWLALRIPSNRLDGFVTIVEDLGNVTNKRESVEDITLRYVDVASHKEALAIEQERLMELLEMAESMEDIISIESRLSEVRYELQSYESTLRTYDNQVNYSTVYLDIYEVERITKVVEERNFFEEIWYRLENNFYDIGRGVRDFAIWFISSLPYLAIWAVGIFVVIKVVQKIRIKKFCFWKRKEKKDSQ